MSALQKITDAAHAVAQEGLTDIRERQQALATEAEALKVECKRLSPDLHKQAEEVWSAAQKAAQGMGEKTQANGRPPNESEGESLDVEHLEEVKKARAS